MARMAQISKGFSLLELIVAIGVLAALVAAAAPSFRSQIEARRVLKVADEIQWVMTQAKSSAVMENKKYYVHIRTGPTWCIVTGPWKKPPTSCANSSVSGWNHFVAYGNNRQINFAKNGSSLISVDPIRSSFDSNGSVSISSGDSKSISIRYIQNGRVAKCSVGGDYYGLPAC